MRDRKKVKKEEEREEGCRLGDYENQYNRGYTVKKIIVEKQQSKVIFEGRVTCQSFQ